jgi:hypothetical protein
MPDGDKGRTGVWPLTSGDFRPFFLTGLPPEENNVPREADFRCYMEVIRKIGKFLGIRVILTPPYFLPLQALIPNREEPRMANDATETRDNLVGGVGLAVVALWLLACLLPCVDCGPAIPYGELDFGVFDRGSHVGLEILLFGWSGGNNGLPWSANLFLVFGLLCLWTRRLRRAVVLGTIASVLGLTTWWVRRYDTLMVGYYFWQSSQLVLVGGTIWAIRRSR